jgi:hypothetical protein
MVNWIKFRPVGPINIIIIITIITITIITITIITIVTLIITFLRAVIMPAFWGVTLKRFEVVNVYSDVLICRWVYIGSLHLRQYVCS